MSAQNSKSTGVLGAITGLLGLSVLAGVLVTALVTPAVAVTGMGAKTGIDIFNSLPEYLEINQLTTKNTIYGIDGEGNNVPIAQLYKQNREEVEWDEVSPYVKDALVAIEDRRFYEHGGVDVASIIRAAIGNTMSDEIQSGGSTLTMQLVKNIRIQAALDEPTEALQKAKMDEAQEQTIVRKLQEAKLAIGLEKKYTKEEILLAYLNIAGFGGNTYGIESAAKQIFSVSAADVTLPQAASLVAIVQTPAAHSLLWEENIESNKKRRDIVLNYMLELGSITPEEHAEAIATPVEVNYSQPTNGCMHATSGPFFCDYITTLVPELEMLGATPEERQANWARGGYHVYTSLQINQQDHAQQVLWQQAPAEETRFELGAVASVVEPGTGRIRVMAQNKYFNNTLEGGGSAATAVNFNTDLTHGGSRGFQAGSTYKIFTLAAWLESGHGLQEVVNGQRRTFQLASFKDSCNGSGSGTYNPPNYGGSGGSSASVLTATAQSHNIAYIAMAQQLDQCAIRKAAEKMGAHRADGQPLETHVAAVLGTNEMSPMSMASAIATVAAGGLACKPTAIDNVIDADGNELGGQTRECTQALTPDVAAGMAHALRQVVTSGTGTASNPRDGIPLIGKTGTTDGEKDTWMIGATTNSALAVWVGNIVGKADLRRYPLPGGYGAHARHRIFQPIIGAMNGQFGGENFPSAPNELLRGQGAIVPNVVGQSQEQAKSIIEALGFTYAYGGEVDSNLPAGQIAQVEPGAGSTIPRGSTVTVYGSRDNAVTMPNVVGMKLNAASAAIGSGFSVSAKCQEAGEDADDDEFGTVVASDPAAGSELFPGASISLTVVRESCD